MLASAKFPKSSACSRSAEPGDNPSRPFHVLLVCCTELPCEHLLLDGDPDDIEGNEGDEQAKPGDPVPEEERLGNRPEKVGGIHRVPDVLVDPGRDQPLPLLHIGIRGKIRTEVGMGPPEQEESGTEDAGPNPAGRFREGIIGRGKVRGEDVDPGEDEHPEGRQVDEPGI